MFLALHIWNCPDISGTSTISFVSFQLRTCSVLVLFPGPLQRRFFLTAQSVSSQAPYCQCPCVVAAKVQICSFQCCIADTISPSVRDYFRAKTLLALNPHCLFACFLVNSSSDRSIFLPLAVCYRRTHEYISNLWMNAHRWASQRCLRLHGRADDSPAAAD